MPELPEVETVARDLARHLVGATIAGARGDWPRTIASHPTAEAFAAARRRSAGRAGGAAGQARRRAPVGRRRADDPPQDDRPALRRRRPRSPAGPPRARRPRARRRSRGPLPRRAQVRARRLLAGGPGHRRACSTARPGRTSSPASGPSRSTTPSRCARSGPGCAAAAARLKPLLLDQAFIAGVGNIYADEALWRARLHPLRTAATLRPPDERASTARCGRSSPRRSPGAAPRSTTTRPPTATASMQERLEVYQRTGEPCPRCGRPIRRIVVDQRATHFCSWCQRLPAGDRPGAAAILAAARAPRARGRRWVDLPGEGTLGLTPRRGRPGRRRAPGPSARAGPPRRAAPARGPAPGAPDDVARPPVERHPRDRHVRDPRRGQRGRRDRRAGRAWSGPNGAGKTTLLRIVAGVDEPDRGEVHRRRALTVGLLAQEAHFDEAFASAPGPADRRPARRGRRRGAWRRELRRLEEAGAAGTPAYADLSHRFAAVDGWTLDQRVDEALSGLGFTPRRDRPLAGGALRRPADPGRAGPPARGRPGPAPPRRADEPPGPRRDRVARGGASGGAAAPCSSPRTTGPSSTPP